MNRQPTPVYPDNIFTEKNLAYPFEHYKSIRDTGPVVRLSRFGPYAISRFHDVGEALQASDQLISGKGVGANPIFNVLSKGKTVISLDGKAHSEQRSHTVKPLLRKKVVTLEPELQEFMDQKLESLVGQGNFDAVVELAQHLPFQVISHMVGVPEVLRQEFLNWGTVGFDAGGPFGKRTFPNLVALHGAFNYVKGIEADSLVPGGWADQAMELFRSGQLELDEARQTISNYLFPSLDSTILTAANMIYELAQNPDQWNLLKEQPNLIKGAVNEAVRHGSVVRIFCRYTAEDYQNGDVFIPKGKRVAILYASANRDERHYENPDKFDITREASDHLGFGMGPHMCAGQHLAKLELKVLLQSLLKYVDKLEIVGEPDRLINAGVWGYSKIPMKLN